MEVTDSTSALPGIVVPQLSLPKGGGSISNIGGTFNRDTFTGTGNCTISLPVTPARGFEPQLTLGYNSAQGNGPFGLGFQLSLNSVTVTTNLGIPAYAGTDLYALTDEGTLVQTSVRTAQYNNEDWRVITYQPRIQRAYSCIEQWINIKDQSSWWKVTSRTKTTTTYGTSDNARIANPSDPTQIFQWLPDSSTDAKGNIITYAYKAENNQNVPPVIYEVNRSYAANRYIQSVQYGNYTDGKGNTQYAFELIFDYGEYDLSNLQQKNADPYTPVREWAYRPDAFSTYSSGFEIRTCRLCQHVMLFHHFESLGTPCLVDSLALEYDALQQYQSAPVISMSMIKTATSTGYRKNTDGSYAGKQLPPVTLDYTPFTVPATPGFDVLQMEGNTIPGYLGEQEFLPVDLNGEGMPGFLLSTDQFTTYLSPQGDGKYALPESPAQFPIDRNLQNGNAYLMDIDSNGQLELLSGKGFYQYNDNGGWSNFQPFISYPVNSSDPFLESTDINANGKGDLLLATETDIQTYISAGKEGFLRVSITQNENGIPVKAAGAREQLVTFTDMFGDGLSHRVSISSGLVECWPCLGHGRYGPKITLENAPVFGGLMNNDRLFLADIDGSGTTDLIYISSQRAEIYMNQNGNSFSPAIVVDLPAQYSPSDQIHFMDVKGNGTSCLVFSKMAPVPVHYYYDFNDGTKPYLLSRISNNMGAVTDIAWCSSTKFMLEDKRAGRPWVTRLRFPVLVVESSTVYDKLSDTKVVNRFKYHDGYYDPIEREFRGFGFVESWDTETFEQFEKSQHNPDFPVDRLNKELYVPPVYTKTWCYTGAYRENAAILQQYQQEYFQGDPQALHFPMSVFDPQIYNADADTMRQAYAALQGITIRTEVYADDNQPVSANPYTVDASNVTVNLVQPKGDNRYAVFNVPARESITYNYERNPLDPAMSQYFVLESDPLNGNIILDCTVYLPRRSGPFEGSYVYEGQQQLYVTANRNSYYNTTQPDNWWRGVLYQQEQFQIINPDLGANAYYAIDEIKTQVNTALQHIIPYLETPAGNTLQAQQLTIGQAYFWNETQDAALPLGQVSTRALLHHQQTAAFTTANISYLFGGNMTNDILQNDGGYYFDQNAGYWFNRGLVQHYTTDPGQFYQLIKSENSFADPSSSLFQQTTFSYDTFYFIITGCRQYINSTVYNETTGVCDYQTMKLQQLTDPNGTVTQVLYDPLGNVVVNALFGQENNTPTGTMRLYDYNSQPAEYVWHSTNKAGGPITFSDILDDPAYYLQGAASYFFYDLEAYTNNGQPVNSIQLSRTAFYHQQGGTSAFECRQQIQYSDGQGRSIETKKLAAGNKWQVSGRVVYNNKGKVTASYFPYFSDTPEYEDQQAIVDEGNALPPTITHYDPLLRPIRIDSPKGFFSKTEFTPWEVISYDEDDTVLDSTFYITFMANYPVNPTQDQINEKSALEQAAGFYNTPSTQINDNTGSPILKMQNNLGHVSPSLFDDIVKGSGVTSQQVWDELVAKKYLSPDGYVTSNFQPYVPGFLLNLAPAFSSLVPKITALLRQNCLTASYTTDITSRVTSVTDARLFYSNVTTGTDYYSFRNGFVMGEQAPILIDSADAGKPYHLNNIFGNLVWTWTPRNYNQLITYDRLQRRTTVRVKQMQPDDLTATADPYPLVEFFTYGESQPNPSASNLRGQLYQLHDLAGIQTNHNYSIQAQVLEGSRQLVSDYKLPVDWNDPASVPMEPEIYTGLFSYNALGQIISSQTPDGSVTTTQYDIKGLPATISVTYQDKTVQNVITQIDYDANDQRTKVYAGNGVRSAYTYEASTLRLLELKSTRQNNDVLQQISYTYDPVGNVTRMTDASIDTVFNNNQQVAPVSDYTYDALYRLTNANGRQHPGITATTYYNNTANGDFKQSKFSQLPADLSALEVYQEQYSYDDSFNLIQTRHTANSASWTRDTPVADDSNHLQDFTYDASGNLRQLMINSTVNLSYNCCDNLVKAGVIQRPDELDDTDYYNYGSNEVRIRKVSERMAHGGSVTTIEEKIYLGNYEIKRLKTINAQQVVTTTLDRQTLRIMDDNRCVLIIHYWQQDTNKKEAATGTRQLRWQLDNHLRNVAMELDSNALLISYEEYFPYGGTSIIAGSSQQEVSMKDYRYAGKECDDSTGLYYYGARYYAPWLGRWLKPDPAGDVDGLNLYTYAGNNPVTFTDGTGMSKEVAVSATTLQHLSDARDAINYVRLYQLPYAGNVRDDVVTTHAESSARLSVSRDILRHTFGDVEAVTAGQDAFNRAASAVGAHGGACNEFSALTHTYLISRPTTEPLIRVWDVGVHHSFTLIGDPRAKSEREVVVVDAWPSHYQAGTLADTRWNHDFSPTELTQTTQTPLVSGAQALLNATAFNNAIAAIPVQGQPHGRLPMYALGDTTGMDDPRGGLGGQTHGQYETGTLAWNGLFHNDYSTDERRTYDYYHDTDIVTGTSFWGAYKSTYVTRTHHTGAVTNFNSWRLF